MFVWDRLLIEEFGKEWIREETPEAFNGISEYVDFYSNRTTQIRDITVTWRDRRDHLMEWDKHYRGVYSYEDYLYTIAVNNRAIK